MEFDANPEGSFIMVGLFPAYRNGWRAWGLSSLETGTPNQRYGSGWVHCPSLRVSARAPRCTRSTPLGVPNRCPPWNDSRSSGVPVVPDPAMVSALLLRVRDQIGVPGSTG